MMDHWKEFYNLIQQQSPINEDEKEYTDCFHKIKTRITDFNVCCIECGLMIFDPKIP